jgi:hypothetical protein
MEITSTRIQRAVTASLLALVFAGGLGAAGLSQSPAAAAPLACAATPASAPATRTTPPTVVAPLPTEAVIAPEVNPPGDIPDNQAFVTYTSATGGYAIAMPEGWARQESGPNVTFTDKLHRFTVEVRCADAAPTAAAAKSVEAPALAQQLPAFTLGDVVAIDLPAGPAILMRYQVNSAPDEVTGKRIRLDVDRYELFRDGREVAISLAVPAGSDNVDVSNQVSRSFQWTF